MFLIQVHGQRRWRIGRVADASWVPGAPLKLLRHFIAFEHDKDHDRITKIIAGYHQFHATELNHTFAGGRGRSANQ